jgi:hypothetical protein
MDPRLIREMLEEVRSGSLDIDAAMSRLRKLPYEELAFARVDHHRQMRCGLPEVIFCPGKRPEQIVRIFATLAETGGNVLATRASEDIHAAVAVEFPRAEFHAAARAITLVQAAAAEPVGHIAVVCAGTSDVPVAEEARVTAELFGQRVTTHYDVGVAGLHRLLAVNEVLQDAKALVVVAGMEGALASVVGGLVAAPVIAVPTSVGYGASFAGVAALLTMLNSCASNVSVVNIDNGFGAGYIASLINRAAAGADG